MTEAGAAGDDPSAIGLDLSRADTSKHLDLRLLRQYLVVCDALSMTAAAGRLGLSTPAVSQLVVRLERDLGVVLFERSSHGLRLTPVGTLMRDRARELLESEGAIMHELEAYRAHLVPRLRIHVVSSVASSVMPAIVQRLNESVGVLDIHSGPGTEYVQDFLRGEIDIVISTEDLHELPRIEQFRLCEERLIGIVPSTLPPEQRRLDVLAGKLPFVRFPRGRRMHRLVEDYLTARDIDPPHSIECSSPGPILELIGHGLGWSIATPLSLSYLKPLSNNISFFPLPEPVAERQIYLVAHAGALLDLPAKLADDCRGALRTAIVSWGQRGGFDLPPGTITVDSPARAAAGAHRGHGHRHVKSPADG